MQRHERLGRATEGDRRRTAGQDTDILGAASAPVSTASTPGAALAAEVSIDLMAACACGERRTWPCARLAGMMSAT
jgi:hypothetical protein